MITFLLKINSLWKKLSRDSCVINSDIRFFFFIFFVSLSFISEFEAPAREGSRSPKYYQIKLHRILLASKRKKNETLKKRS